jgi:hypothetical protein
MARLMFQPRFLFYAFDFAYAFAYVTIYSAFSFASATRGAVCIFSGTAAYSARYFAFFAAGIIAWDFIGL